MNDDPVMKELLKGFLVETKELSRRLTTHILELEQKSDQPAAMANGLSVVARDLHTLKGSSATLGMEEVAELAHRMEDVLAPVRSKAQPFNSALADALLQALDILVSAVQARIDGKAPPAAALEKAAQVLDASKGAAPIAVPVKAPGTPEEEAPAAAVDEVREAAAAHEWRVATAHVLSLGKGIERVRELGTRADRRREAVSRLIKSTEKWTFEQATELRPFLAELNRSLSLDAEELGDCASSFEDDLKQICTSPLRIILDPLQRVVRDLCRQLGKEVRLAVVGAELGVDRRLLEQLSAPLQHLVRNAIDHGFERPEEREAAGKHREGALVIRAELTGNLLSLEVADDGAGLDAQKIAAAAESKGLVSREEAQRMATPEIQQLIFRSGFSTRSEVSQTSGRGVGLDVVRAQVMALDGQVDVQSQRGQGTRFLLTLPVELGTSVVLVVRCAEHELGIPVDGIERLLLLNDAQVRIARGKLELVHGDAVLPMVDLAGELQLRSVTLPGKGSPVALLRVDGERVAVALDEIVGERELVIRPLPPELRHLEAYLGSASGQDNLPMLVLRPQWLNQRSNRGVAELAELRKVLVVDDSLTARALHRSILEAGGFRVHAVSNAEQALRHLSVSSYDAIVSDINMESMNGIELTRTLRRNNATRRTPVLLVSAGMDDSEKARGVAAGADAFLSKRECSEGKLLQEVSRVLSRRGDA